MEINVNTALCILVTIPPNHHVRLLQVEVKLLEWHEYLEKVDSSDLWRSFWAFIVVIHNTTHETSYLLSCVLQQTWIPTVSKYDQHDNVNATWRVPNFYITNHLKPRRNHMYYITGYNIQIHCILDTVPLCGSYYSHNKQQPAP